MRGNIEVIMNSTMLLFIFGGVLIPLLNILLGFDHDALFWSSRLRAKGISLVSIPLSNALLIPVVFLNRRLDQLVQTSRNIVCEDPAHRVFLDSVTSVTAPPRGHEP